MRTNEAITHIKMILSHEQIERLFMLKLTDNPLDKNKTIIWLHFIDKNWATVYINLVF